MLIVVMALYFLIRSCGGYSTFTFQKLTYFTTRILSSELIDQPTDTEVYDEILAEKIRKRIKNDLIQWRKNVADEIQKPQYNVLQNRQIDSIISIVPTTLKELENVPTIGPKTMNYGSKILEIITKRMNSVPNLKIKPLDRNAVLTTDQKAIRRAIDIRNLITFNTTFEDLSPEQQSAAKNVIEHNNNVFITGSAGTGKSYLLRYIIQELRKKYGFAEVAVTAPTGIAAVNIGGSTVHSFAGLGIAMSTPAVMIKKSLKRKDIVEKWENLKVLIIDEISMLDIRLFELLDQMAKTARKSDAPFGGVQLIVVGDFLQLPPVRTSPPKSYSNQKYAIPEPPPRNELFCFESSCWEAAGLNTPNGSIRLKEVVRQSDGDFISLLNRIRVGDSSNELMSLLESCVVGNKTLPTDGIVPTKLYCLNKDVDEENASKLAAILEDEIIISSDDTWKIIPVTIANRKRLHEMADKIIPSNLILKRGAQVVLLRNRANDVAKYNRKFAVGIAPGKKPLVNGSRGIVIGFVDSVRGGKESIPKVRFDDGQIVAIGKVEYEIHGSEGDGLLIRSQIPLKLAWATTVHKSQGTTLSRAEIMMNNAFDFGQTYVALSRVQSLDGLWLTKPLLPSAIKAHPIVLKFYGYSD